MFENLTVFEKRLEELNQRMYDPSVVSDPESYARIMKEYKNLEPIVAKYREYLAAGKAEKDAQEMLGENGLDRELKEMVQQELEQAREKESSAEELKVLLLPRDPNDERNVIVEIRAGAGGEEAALFRRVCSACTACTPG